MATGQFVLEQAKSESAIMTPEGAAVFRENPRFSGRDIINISSNGAKVTGVVCICYLFGYFLRERRRKEEI
jgi:hypothetical protein